MTDQTHMFDEDIGARALEIMERANRAFALGAEVAVVKFQVGAAETDPYKIAIAVGERVTKLLRPAGGCRTFCIGDRMIGDPMRGHYEVRRKS